MKSLKIGCQLFLYHTNKARSWYWHKYKSNNGNTITNLYFPMLVDLELKNLRWVIVDEFDQP